MHTRTAGVQKEGETNLHRVHARTQQRVLALLTSGRLPVPCIMSLSFWFSPCSFTSCLRSDSNSAFFLHRVLRASTLLRSRRRSFVASVLPCGGRQVGKKDQVKIRVGLSPVLPLLTWRSSSDMVECGCSFW